MRINQRTVLIIAVVVLTSILCACMAFLLHTHDFQTQILAQPSCDKEGLMKTSCTRCWIAFEEPIAKLEHTYGEAVLAQEATCKEEGKMVARCTVCAAEKVTQVFPKTEDHTFVDTMLRDSTCADGGEGQKSCAVCGFQETYTYPLKEHTYEEPVVTLQPTCSQVGAEEARCSVCSHVLTSELPMIAHAWGYAPCDQPATCQSCGAKDTKPSGHNYQMTGHREYIDPGMAGRKTYICSKCGDDHVEYYGRYGSFDLEAIQNEANNYAASLGFHINEAVVDHEYVNVSRNWFYFVNLDSPRVYTEILYEAKALVNYEYNRAVQNHPAKGPAGYYMWVKLTYYENNLVGYLDVQTFVAFTD